MCLFLVLTPHKQYTVMYSQLTQLGTDMFQTCHFYMKEKYTHMKVKIQNKVGALKKKKVLPLEVCRHTQETGKKKTQTIVGKLKTTFSCRL